MRSSLVRYTSIRRTIAALPRTMPASAPLSYAAALSGKRNGTSNADTNTTTTRSSHPAPSPDASQPSPNSASPGLPRTSRPQPQPQRQPRIPPQGRPSRPPTRGTHVRNPSHIPRSDSASHPAAGPSSSASSESVHVLTLLTTAAHAAALTALRTQHFPRALNKLDAHLTLFHALPAAHLPAITAALAALAAATPPFALATGPAVRLRQGVAVAVPREAGGARAQRVRDRLRADLLARRVPLSEQDRAAGWRPHYTVMNKVAEEPVVEAALRAVRTEFVDAGGSAGVVLGVVLWRYERGWWRDGREFRFREGAADEGGEGEAGAE
ncbi:hypothetical protein B0A49_10586 [Cryomyces minteri]|uniref:Uncharacterized protein n=1 Tax=Cryomyces minteri TaxID=331657 RepID=A0A4U0W7X3_9PEZI|nr:hypothetical protein B0A49_10586 [Cryomyces minteri]